MRTEELVTMEILPTGQVHVLITTIYYLEDEELTRKNFRVTLDVGEYDKAREYLDDYYISILESVWI
jgi:hypothetical protein